jgi:uncharacterized membrane protein
VDTVSDLKPNPLYSKALRFGSHICHQRNDRSFYSGLRKFPVCARCTGIYLALPLGVVLALIFPVNPAFLIPLLLPLILDGTIQLFSSYESNNKRRLVTGMLFGFAYGMGLVMIFEWLIRLIF